MWLTLHQDIGTTRGEKYFKILERLISGLEALPARLEGCARVDGIAEQQNRSFPADPEVVKPVFPISTEILEPSGYQSRQNPLIWP